MMWLVSRQRTSNVIAILAAAFLATGLAGDLMAADPATASTPPLLKFDRPATIVCLGDSVTGVYYHTGGRGAYPEMLEVGLKRLHPQAQITVINAGISGQTTQNGLVRLDADVLSKKPDLVTVSFGLNDVTRIPPADYKKNLIETITRCRAAKAQVVLCTPNAVIDTPARPLTKVTQYCDIIREVGRELAVPVCDQYQAGEAHRQRDPAGWRLTLSDEIHPNLDGHKLMAQELCRVIAGKDISLADVGPLAPALTKTVSLLKEHKPVRVLAMPPYDTLITGALQKYQADGQIEVTVWQTAGKSLAELEKESEKLVRKLAPHLVVLAVPRSAVAGTDEQFAHSYTWVMNWSLSFGYQDWDCIVVHPSVTNPDEVGPRDNLLRQLIRAQHLHCVDRQPGDKEPASVLFDRWIEAAIGQSAKSK